jgi:hypothetical protein
MTTNLPMRDVKVTPNLRTDFQSSRVRAAGTGEPRLRAAGSRDDQPASRVGDNWRDRAACAGADTDRIFYPNEKNQNGDYYREARTYCARCTVTVECAAEADRFGFWAGMSPEQRAQLVRQR